MRQVAKDAQQVAKDMALISCLVTEIVGGLTAIPVCHIACGAATVALTAVGLAPWRDGCLRDSQAAAASPTSGAAARY